MTSKPEMLGQWNGTYSLWFGDGPPHSVSPTSLEATAELSGQAMLMCYDWQLEDQAHEGLYLLTTTGSAAFCDSFHTGGTIMACEPGPDDSVTGTYEGDGETWKWRTQVTVRDDELMIRAWNGAPNGTETLATEALYHRA